MLNIITRSIIFLIFSSLFGSRAFARDDNMLARDNIMLARDVTECKVFLNHVGRVIDLKIIQEMMQSEFIMNEFSYVSHQTISSGDLSWTNFILGGENTYIELLEPSKENEVGLSVFATSVDEDCIDQVYTKVKAEFPETQKNLVHLISNEQKIPWFYEVEWPLKQSKLITWVMQYDKDFLKILDPSHPQNCGGITRKEYNSRIYDSNRLFKNIVAVKLTLNQNEANHFDRFEKARGHSRVPLENGIVKYIGPDYETIVQIAPDSFGVSELKLELSRSVEKEQNYIFGNGKVILSVFTNSTATLKFMTQN